MAGSGRFTIIKKYNTKKKKLLRVLRPWHNLMHLVLSVNFQENKSFTCLLFSLFPLGCGGKMYPLGLRAAEVFH